MKLSARELLKKYKGKPVVDNVSLELSEGETLGLLGPNGAGKTTLFYLITGLLKTDSGSIFLDEKEITNKNIFERSLIGLSYLSQENSIFRRLTVQENIMASLEQRKNLSKVEQSQECGNLIEEFNLNKFSNTKGSMLSGGERRRTEIARALALSPRFLLLDEPFAGIDPIAVSELKKTIENLNKKGIGVLISDHNVRETMGICDKVIILSEGKIVAEGSPDIVANNSLVKKVYLGDSFEI